MVSKSFIFLVESFLGNFYRYLEKISGHTDGLWLVYSQIRLEL